MLILILKVDELTILKPQAKPLFGLGPRKARYISARLPCVLRLASRDMLDLFFRFVILTYIFFVSNLFKVSENPCEDHNPRQ